MVATIALYAAMIVTTNDLAERHNRLLPCQLRHCNGAELSASQQFANGFDWSIFYAMASFTTALIIILALLLKMHEDLVWNIPTRKLMMRHNPHYPLDKLEKQVKRCLSVSVWVLLAMGFLFVIVLYEYARNTT